SEEEAHMSRKFSIRPGVTLKGRQFKGLRGWAGKPFHPALTDVPVGAYVLVAVFDVISRIAGNDSSIGRDFFISGTHVIIAGAIVSLAAALTGFWDWWKSTSPGNQARRTANWHMTVMLTVTGIVILDIIIRLAQWSDNEATSTIVMILSIIIGGLTAFGATYGGSLTYDYGFNVETSGDHPVWHESEVDVFPGQH
ncbi:MAG TPA: DUF2231 domain-containing protein, partial [Acidimicrobiia bacterium]|nr:DUF2231 domain-containing protein [Acidimicrobiia bacterium]